MKKISDLKQKLSKIEEYLIKFDIKRTQYKNKILNLSIKYIFKKGYFDNTEWKVLENKHLIKLIAVISPIKIRKVLGLGVFNVENFRIGVEKDETYLIFDNFVDLQNFINKHNILVNFNGLVAKRDLLKKELMLCEDFLGEIDAIYSTKSTSTFRFNN